MEERKNEIRRGNGVILIKEILAIGLDIVGKVNKEGKRNKVRECKIVV